MRLLGYRHWADGLGYEFHSLLHFDRFVRFVLVGYRLVMPVHELFEVILVRIQSSTLHYLHGRQNLLICRLRLVIDGIVNNVVATMIMVFVFFCHTL